MRLIVDTSGRVHALGGDSLAPGEGQEARETTLTMADLAQADAALAKFGGPGEIWHDAKADVFRVRGRPKSAREQADDERRDLAASLEAAIANFDKLTPPQKDAAMHLTLKAALRVVR